AIAWLLAGAAMIEALGAILVGRLADRQATGWTTTERLTRACVVALLAAPVAVLAVSGTPAVACVLLLTSVLVALGTTATATQLVRDADRAGLPATKAPAVTT